MKGTFLSKYNEDFVDLLKVNLPELRPAKVWKDLEKYRSDHAGLARYFSRHFKTKIQIEYTPKRDIPFSVSGEFDQVEERMIIYVNRQKTLNDLNWKALKFEIIVTLMHEYVHFMQYMYNDDVNDLVLLHKEHLEETKEEEREYYASWSEIQAYAHCILMEMKDRNIHKPCSEMLRHPRQYYSPTLRHIKTKFDGFDYPLKYLYREVLRWEKRYEMHAKSLNIT